MPVGAIHIVGVEILIGLLLSRQRPEPVIRHGGVHIVANVNLCTTEAKYNYKEKP